ncbi:hypothetical protein HYS31_08170 [Candidatus Woesearchaeota archaeon]|nr:hypothetical protein [Candidatus Woesearchaeota archaeon]
MKDTLIEFLRGQEGYYTKNDVLYRHDNSIVAVAKAKNGLLQIQGRKNLPCLCYTAADATQACCATET